MTVVEEIKKEVRGILAGGFSDGFEDTLSDPEEDFATYVALRRTNVRILKKIRAHQPLVSEGMATISKDLRDRIASELAWCCRFREIWGSSSEDLMLLHELHKKIEVAWVARGSNYGPDSIYIALAWYYWLRGDRMPWDEKRAARDFIRYRQEEALFEREMV